MATTATLVTIAPRQFPYIGIGIPAAQLPTFIPSAEIIFQTISSAITVAAAGETQSVLVTCNLPVSFCYVLVEMSMRIESIDALDWSKGTNAELMDSSSAPEILIPLVIDSINDTEVTETTNSMTYSLKNPPTKLIVPAVADDARLSVFTFNSTIDGAVAAVRFYARFLRFDRNQAQFWQVNTPVLVR